MALKNRSSVRSEEISQFSRQADLWWREAGPFSSLHRLNPLRLAYIRAAAEKYFDKKPSDPCPFLGLDVLDVGCGGGILTEPLARLGGRVLGLDASESGIAAAKQHAKRQGLSIDYHVGTAEGLLSCGQKRFDFITAMEILEHVDDLNLFLESLAALLNPGGVLIVSTINRTFKSYALGIVAAEYLLRWVPPGTHHYRQFVRPSTLVEQGEALGLLAQDIQGMVFNPLSGSFELRTGRVDVNYIMTFQKIKKAKAKV